MFAKICTRLKKIKKLRKGRTRWNVENLHAYWQKVQDILLQNLSALECKTGNVGARWNNIQKCVLDTISDLVRKIDRKAREPQITQEMISKMNERKK